MIKTRGFRIHSSGDPSVGIFSSDFELSPDFIFESQDELDEFKEELSKLFESYVTGEHTAVETFEEYEKGIEEENKMFSGDDTFMPPDELLI